MTTDPIYQKLVSAHVALSEAIEMVEAKPDKTKTTADMPDRFIAVIPRSRLRRYTRSIEDSWDVHQWDDRWQFYDNVGETTAREAFNGASFVASELWHKSDGTAKEPNPTCIADPRSHFDWLVKFIEDVKLDNLQRDGDVYEAASEVCRVILEHAEFIKSNDPNA